MKKLILITTASILLGIFSSAAPVITAKPGSSFNSWDQNSAWDLLRKPLTGDTVIIPAGVILVISNHENLGSGNLFIKIYGILNFKGGKLTMGTGSTIIVYPGARITGTGSMSEQIRIGTVKKYQGDEDIVGPQIANASTGAGFNPYATALPVKFVGFTVTPQGKNALVQWSTTEEVNADRYEVERSENGSTWTTIALINTKGNGSNNINQYSYTDKNITRNLMYYRIRQVDFDGRYIHTAIQIARFEGKASGKISISAGQGKILLLFPVQTKGTTSVHIFSMNGQLVNQQTVSNALGQVILDSNIKGHYMVAVTTSEGIRSAAQIIL